MYLKSESVTRRLRQGISSHQSPESSIRECGVGNYHPAKSIIRRKIWKYGTAVKDIQVNISYSLLFCLFFSLYFGFHGHILGRSLKNDKIVIWNNFRLLYVEKGSKVAILDAQEKKLNRKQPENLVEQHKLKVIFHY